MAHRTSPIGTDIQVGGYGLPRIPFLGTLVNRGQEKGRGRYAQAPPKACVAPIALRSYGPVPGRPAGYARFQTPGLLHPLVGEPHPASRRSGGHVRVGGSRRVVPPTGTSAFQRTQSPPGRTGRT